MASLTFARHQLVSKLHGCGFTEQLVEALVEALVDKQREAERVTPKDLQIELTSSRSDLSLIMWLRGLLLAGVLALVFKTFSP